VGVLPVCSPCEGGDEGPDVPVARGVLSTIEIMHARLEPTPQREQLARQRPRSVGSPRRANAASRFVAFEATIQWDGIVRCLDEPRLFGHAPLG
jgi:hypothetical protein